MKKILVLGADGYIGKPLCLHLERKGHEVYKLDDFRRRRRAESLVPLKDNYLSYDEHFFCQPLKGAWLNRLNHLDCIIHLAQQPSAPWSMANPWQAIQTQEENVLGNLWLLWQMKQYFPDAHLIKLGSMGEYGTPDCKIPEGFIHELCPQYEMTRVNCPYGNLTFPKQPNSFYHLSKCFDSMNIEFACKTWGLTATDIMQGIVFGLNYWDEELTRFDYDEYFGTVINRFCAQAVAGVPLTVYGTGGQIRGFLPLEDSIKCIDLLIDNPPEKGEYRAINQFAEYKTVHELSMSVLKASSRLGIEVDIDNLENPRKESENHFYAPKNEKLKAMGYKPDWNLVGEIEKLLSAILPYKNQIDKTTIQPTTKWK